jgi:hypothetical protein
MADFDAVQNALDGLGATTGASEAHGVLCALLLDDGALPLWLRHILDELPEEGDVLAAERVALLARLYLSTQRQLDSGELEFELLLPDESDDFGQRLQALASWCQGFVYGVGVGGLAEDDRFDDQARECLSDLVEISRLGYDEESSDEAELQFAEIAEHVRMATLLLNESLHPPESPAIH